MTLTTPLVNEIIRTFRKRAARISGGRLSGRGRARSACRYAGINGRVSRAVAAPVRAGDSGMTRDQHAPARCAAAERRGRRYGHWPTPGSLREVEEMSRTISRGLDAAARRPRAITLGELRPSQIITTFGPGAVTDQPTASLMLAGTDHWTVSEDQRIDEPRLRALLGVRNLYRPGLRSDHGMRGVPAFVFPTHLGCPRCQRLATYQQLPLRRTLLPMPQSGRASRGAAARCPGPKGVSRTLCRRLRRGTSG